MCNCYDGYECTDEDAKPRRFSTLRYRVWYFRRVWAMRLRHPRREWRERNIPF